MYSVYKKQDEAFANDGGGPVWARDNAILEKTVTKRYICSSYEEFWSRYSRMTDDERHHYEIIRGPCHLYFDVEYIYKEADDVKEKFGDVSCALFDFIEVTKKVCMHCEFANKFELFMLDSSDQSKFSKHLIFKMYLDDTPVMLKSNAECSILLSLIRQEWNDTYKIIDDTVYTKNRLFRLIGESLTHYKKLTFNRVE